MDRASHVDLFSGIGGFALAARWAGYETVLFCEVDPFCRSVLAKNFPGVPVHDDVRTLNAGAVARPIDLLTGGFPCQPFSVAGERRGTDDDRHLWPEMARVVDEVRPRWVLGENVAGFVNMALDDCLADLEGLGYEARAIVVPACAVGAWHRRDRVWIVAHAGEGGRGARQPALLPRAGQPDAAGRVERAPADAERIECGERRDPDVLGRRQDKAQQTRLGGSGQDDEGRTADDADGGRHGAPGVAVPPGRYGPLDADWWEAQRGLRGVPPGLSSGLDRHRVSRLKALGNSIVPQVAYEFIRLMAVDAGSSS